MIRGRFDSLWAKLKRFNTAPRRILAEQDVLGFLSNLESALVIVDGSQGGGATFASRRAEQQALARGNRVCRIGVSPLGELLVTLVSQVPVSTNNSAFDVGCGSGEDNCKSTASGVDGGSEELRLSARLAGWPDLKTCDGLRIRVDSLVGFSDPATLANWLKRCARRGARLSVQWHDHYMLCPSHFLLNDQNQFCELPVAEKCRDCLPKNENCQLSDLRLQDISGWRAQWLQVLTLSDEVVAFSPSSVQLITREFPSPVVLRPHDMGHFYHQGCSATVKSGVGTNIHVAVIGHIGRHKGAFEVAALSHMIFRQKLPLKFTVFGTIDEAVSGAVVTELGAYEPANLPKLLADYAIDLVWFPSIWPETFSFVLHEVMALNWPILAFDLGAQADFLRGYPAGRLLRYGADPLETYQALNSLYQAWCADAANNGKARV